MASLTGDVITKDDVFDVMEEDLAVADMVLWVGISFEQSASTSYFRRVSSCICSPLVQRRLVGKQLAVES